MSKYFYTFIFFIALSLSASAQNIQLVTYAKGFSGPVYLTAAPGEKNSLYIVEQRGTIQKFVNDKKNLFLDIRDRVRSGGEKGLLSMAFHPKYPTDNRIFVNYTKFNGTLMRGTLYTRISEFKVNLKKAQAQSASERVILEIKQPYSNHNGGQIAFGKDGYLYIGMGDGGSGGDPRGHGQNVNTLLGAMLRIDINKKPYGIPPTNPFAKNRKGKPEIWAYGLRNPWRFSFDRKTGQLYVADVGQNKYEEVHIVEKGKNYGWNIMEGKHCYKPARNCKTSGLVRPIAEYDHSQGQSITGGFVYRGKKFPQLTGVYLYADYVQGKIWGLKPGKWNKLLLDTRFNISSFGEDVHGEVYVMDLGKGMIFRIEAK